MTTEADRGTACHSRQPYDRQPAFGGRSIGWSRLFGLPPEMLGADSGNSQTYANVESRDLSLLKYAVGPWLGRLERAMDTLVPRSNYVKFNAAALLKTDTLSRYQAHEIGLRAGFLTIEEVRELEDRQPLPEGSPARPAPLVGVA